MTSTIPSGNVAMPGDTEVASFDSRTEVLLRPTGGATPADDACLDAPSEDSDDDESMDEDEDDDSADEDEDDDSAGEG